MYSIKIKSYSEGNTYPLYETLTAKENKANDIRSPETSLLEATGIWHRKFHIFDQDEYLKWAQFYGLNDEDYDVPGMHPVSILKDDQNDLEYPVEFEMLVYKDTNNKENVCILLNVECYIMNECGQTVDKIVI